MPHGADGDRAQQLILGVIERLRRRHHDRIAGVDAHGVDVLHVAYRDAVVAGVAHHLVLDLLPALETLLDQYLGDAAGESAPQGRFDLRLEPHDAAALPAERVAAAQHDRQPDLADRAPRCIARIAWIGVPSTWMPCFASTPASCSARPQFNAVCPPNPSAMASTPSLAMIFSTSSGVTAAR